VTDEQRLQVITDQLILVRDNLFRGMSKSIQKLQARSINEVLGLENFTRSPQRQWVGLADEEILKLAYPLRWQEVDDFEADKAVNFAQLVEAKLKEKNT
jgi:hypothetical protein